eukprot:TRINITY_DN5375_c0_g1_i1.p2 TRINITY_DN5375_c0_g1~~TRINITY_DN5375_c0_g1_i1.p2  ORF type:complete len:151 (-),score=53.14 TRINITY_DN5375_c0_g1_i1:64-516(-)
MLIFQDLLGSQDELMSDSFPMELVDDVIYKVKTSMIVDDDTDDEIEVINMVKIHNLNEVNYTKKQFGLAIKAYMGKVIAHLTEHAPERVDIFKKGAQAFVVKEVMANFKDWVFYTGKEMDPTGMIVLGRWEEGAAPVFYLWSDGLSKVKF